MSSGEYRQLEQRFAELRSQFVDFEIPIERDPTSAELNRIAAFKLLMHAEIETYIEDRILRTLAESIQKWLSTRTVSRCLFNLLARWSVPHSSDDRFGEVHDGDRIDELVRHCEKRARKEIVDNNSIKQEAFVRMCCSAGVLVQDLDNALLAELDSFGKTRGEVAHKGVGKVHLLNAPSVEAQSAENIVKLLARFDLDLALLSAS